MYSSPLRVNSKWVGFNFGRIYPDPSDLIIPFEDHDLVALPGKLAGGDEACATGADHCHAAGVLHRRGLR